mmetsp:Transcript_11972/g.19225  ORF Transcript_11972/g.19225 Transcript_11972/m.19225 type:complete len:180 (-) Transcript_11972:236-775(-)
MAAPRAAPWWSTPPPARVYVGNLPWSCDWRQLKDLCRGAGDVLHADVTQDKDGRSKGYGIVQFSSAEEAGHAIRQLDGMRLGDRTISAAYDAHDPAISGEVSLYVGNLAWTTSWQRLKDHFKQAGEVTFADIPAGPDGRSKGFGLVRYASKSGAEKAIRDLHGTELDGRVIDVREDRKN